VTAEQVERAKTQLIAQFLRDMEIRAIMMESFARETVAYGEPTDPNVTCEKISKIEKADLIKLAKKLLNGVPSVSILGEANKEDTKSLYDDVCVAQFHKKPLVQPRQLYMTKDGKFYYA
jgi:predicted Zn-dependent peptidase